MTNEEYKTQRDESNRRVLFAEILSILTMVMMGVVVTLLSKVPYLTGLLMASITILYCINIYYTKRVRELLSNTLDGWHETLVLLEKVDELKITENEQHEKN